MQIKEDVFKIIVKPNSAKNEIVKFDNERKAYRVNIKEKAEDNKANIEIIKFFSKLLKKKVKIIKGLKSKEKIIKVE
ncbi:MAG: YggU family protein [Nanoarchaeota archaeon]|nr:YggU family protein [Nanoarchaeota archaeon]